MKEQISRKRLFVLIISMLLAVSAIACIAAFPWKDSSPIRPVNGVLDLQNWEPDKAGVLSLNGEWGFYWKRFLTPKGLTAGGLAPDITPDVPSAWNSYKINGQNLPGFGYGTYVLKIVNARKGVPLSLRVPTFSASYALYIDDLLVSSGGRVGRSREEYRPGYKPQVVEYTPDKTDFELTVHVSNFANAYAGGMWHAVQLGTPEQIRHMDRIVLYRDLILFGALSLMALYYMSFFLLRRGDRSSLYFALMCVMIAGRILIYGDFLIESLFPFVGFGGISSIDYISLCCFPVFVLLVIGKLFPEETSGIVLKVVSIYAGGMSLLFIAAPVYFYSVSIYIVEAIALLTGFYAIACLSTAFARGRKGSLLLLAGGLQLAVAGVHDLLYQNNVVLSAFGDFMPFGLLILLFIQSFVLSQRFSQAFKDVSILSQKLLKLDKLKDDFLANTSHELRTPLSGILGIAEAMLGGSGGELSAGQRQDLSIIAGSSRRLANLVNDILDYSRMKSGDIPLNLRPVQIGGPIRTVAKVFQQLSQSKEYEVLTEIPGKLPSVLADENRVVQILYNLVGNAVKFTVRGCVRISVREAGNMAEVCVSDTGEGIPEDRLEDIFKSFEQVDTSLTRRHGGTGLGLPITKHLVELQGGTIRAESRPGAGSRFFFTLPLAGAEPGAAEPLPAETIQNRTVQELAAGREEMPVIAHGSQGDSQVLVVDDDTVSLQAAASILRLGGYDVVTAGSGRAALAELAGHRDFSAVILDVMMPEMSGYEVCRKIREDRPGFELPVLMLTARASTRDVLAGFEAGANDYLSKPFESEELLARVRTLTGLKASVDRAMAAETVLMQAQIKPHFLFNTLNTISSFCDSDPDRARQLIDDFSNYLRQSFDFKSLEMYVSLERELSLVSSYVEIEKARFGDQLKVELDIEGGLGLRIPLLSIQPLVENAISHGLRKKGGRGTVTVSVKKVPEAVAITVTDDGQGIPGDRLERLLMPETATGIGLWNIDRRLKKLYGTGLSIESSPGRGTRVAFKIPSEVI